MIARIAGGATLLVAAGLLIWFLLPALPRADEVRLRQEPWDLPELPAASGDAEIQEIAAHNLWGISATQNAESKALTPPDWHIVGVYNTGSEMAVLLKFDNDSLVKTLKPGDSLPGGNKILAVGDDSISILINGKKRILRTYRE